MLNLNSMPESTKRIFEYLKGNPLLRDFALIGGTAMALQIGHRKSEDLDFWVSDDKLNRIVVDSIVNNAKVDGFDTRLATPHHKIVSAKINGVDLLTYSRDYVIGGVKVTFFARNDLPYRYFNEFDRIADTGTSFKIMGKEGLFAMKAFVIHRRVRSRDLYDLKTFLNNGKTLQDILETGLRADISCQPEYAISVLTGEVPLDAQDEGFDSIGVKESIEDIYSFFKCAVDEFEQSVAMRCLRP